MYILGVFRRTTLWSIMLLVLGLFAMKNTGLLYYLVFLICAYLFFALIHILVCKIKERSDSIGKIYFSALGHDLIAPFSKLGTFFAVLTKRWIIHDDSAFHNFVDGFQVVTGGIWSLVILATAVLCVVVIVK